MAVPACRAITFEDVGDTDSWITQPGGFAGNAVDWPTLFYGYGAPNGARPYAAKPAYFAVHDALFGR